MQHTFVEAIIPIIIFPMGLSNLEAIVQAVSATAHNSTMLGHLK